MKLKSIAVELFSTLTKDEKLLELMEVPKVYTNGKYKYLMKDIKKQFLEEKNPGDLVDTDFIRLCVYELPATKSRFSILERSYIQIDIYVTKKRNVRDRRTLMIADRLRELLHNSKIFDYDITYFNRNPDSEAQNAEWTKYGITFCYSNIII
ncbi:hypothetical protein KQI68_07360 [Peptoniphilus sp. MSJ-1]|uniref:Uncharacterized protein n=1 Tax=Peptoniphilus ovalis TaxID=2841503 RepID=A0ABS6FHK6_9FIRM|nr:hypothetical protein [Peptoniphilus ovalis]MBU5669657.1 hypothetical protein [Peptoniphilus ovalis]